MTARPGADSEIFGEEDDVVLELEPPVGFTGIAHLRGLQVKLRKLNTFIYLTVNTACIFAHKRYKYAEKSVGLLRLQMLVGVHHSHPLPFICP